MTPIDTRGYDEKRTDTTQIRNEQWAQMQRYLQRLSSESENRPLYPADFSSEEAYTESVEPLRELLKERIGYPPPGFSQPSEPRLEKAGEDAIARYHRCWISVTPEMDVYALYIVPKSGAAAPLVVALHGGGGCPEHAIYEGAGNYNDMIRGAVERGYVVLAPLMIFHPGCDEQAGTDIPSNARPIMDRRLKLLGTTTTAAEVRKIELAVEAVTKRAEVDAGHIGIVGLSYGGMYVLYAAALLEQINCAISSCFFNRPVNRFDMEAPTDRLDMGVFGSMTELADAELAALICPRPLQVQVGIEDELFPVEGARKEARRVQEYYERLGILERYSFQAFDGGHEWCGEVAWEFLKRWI